MLNFHNNMESKYMEVFGRIGTEDIVESKEVDLDREREDVLLTQQGNTYCRSPEEGITVCKYLR